MEYYLLTGSNEGNPLDNLIKAEKLLNRNAGKIIDASAVYMSGAWGNTLQHAFLNRVLKLDSELDAQVLLDTILTTEKLIGRVRNEKWGPRIIDIDILTCEETVLTEKHITIPHPELPNRRFTLVPFAEIAPDFIHPALNKSIATLLSETTDKGWVKRISNPLSWRVS